MSHCILPTDEKCLGLEKELLFVRVTTKFINFVDPILYSSLHDGFHVYYSSAVTTQKMKEIAHYVKTKYNFEARIDPYSKYCRFYRAKNTVASA